MSEQWHREETAEREPAESAHAGGAEPRLTMSVIFETLANPRRRCVLHHLRRNDGVATVGEMARTIAAWEADIPESAVSSKARKRVYTSLYQVHLPKMDRAGFVEYDRRSGSVALLDRAAQLDVQLEVVGDSDIPWSQFYLGLSGLFALVATLAFFAVPPVTAIPATVWALVFAVLFVAASAVHVHRSRASSIWAGERPTEMASETGESVVADD
jgi:DNA-binding transcriptional ArsR family regulator